MDWTQASHENLLAIMGTLTNMCYIPISLSGDWFSHFKLLRMWVNHAGWKSLVLEQLEEGKT